MPKNAADPAAHDFPACELLDRAGRFLDEGSGSPRRGAFDLAPSATRSATPTAGTRSARAACSRGGWSRRASGVVTVNMFETVFNRVTWDCHGASAVQHARRLRRRAAADLRPRLLGPARRPRPPRPARVDPGRRHRRVRPHARGSTPTAAATTGRASGAPSLAGGGIRGGQVIGASDAHAASPADRPVTPGRAARDDLPEPAASTRPATRLDRPTADPASPIDGRRADRRKSSR